jgi:hypothetical protein
MTDWQNYPLSVDPQFCSPYLFNTKYSTKLLSDNAERLFVSNDELHIKVVEVGIEGVFFYSKSGATTAKNYRLHFYRLQISRRIFIETTLQRHTYIVLLQSVIQLEFS